MRLSSSLPRHLAASGLAALVGLSLTACAPRAAAPVVRPEPTTPATTETPTGAPTAVPSTLVDRASPAPTIDSASVGGLTSAPWRLVAITADGRTLAVFAEQGGGCDEPRGLEVVERANEVELVSLYERRTPSPEVACFDVLHEPLWTVRLAEPLGARRLVHAPTVGTAP